MYFEIIQKNITKVKTDAIVVTQKLSRQIDRQKLSRKNLIEVCTPSLARGEFKKFFLHIFTEENCKKYKTVAIPIIGDAFDDPIIKIINSFMRTLNKDPDDSLLKCMLKPKSYRLKKIKLIADSEDKRNILERKIKDKRLWPTARKISFIIDALDYKKNHVKFAKRHFVAARYEKHFREFSKDCKKELLTRLENELRYSSDIFYEVINKILEINNLLSNAEISDFAKFYIKYFDEECPLIVDGSTKARLKINNPLYLYISELKQVLFADDVYEKMMSFKNTNDQKKYKRMQIKEEFKIFKRKIFIIRMLRGNSVFPVELLKHYWADDLWDIINSENNLKVAVIKILAKIFDYEFNTAKDYIER